MEKTPKTTPSGIINLGLELGPELVLGNPTNVRGILMCKILIDECALSNWRKSRMAEYVDVVWPTWVM